MEEKSLNNSDFDEDQVETADPTPEEADGRLSVVVGRTNYLVGVHFCKNTKQTYDDKAKRLMLESLKNGVF